MTVRYRLAHRTRPHYAPRAAPSRRTVCRVSDGIKMLLGSVVVIGVLAVGIATNSALLAVLVGAAIFVAAMITQG